EVGRGQLVNARLSLAEPLLETGEVADTSCWVLKGLLYFDPKHLADVGLKTLESRATPQPQSINPLTVAKVNSPNDPKDASSPPRILIPQSAPWNDRECATSFGAFMQARDTYWQLGFTSPRDA